MIVLCARCNARLTCTPEEGECWCMHLPPLIPVPSESSATGCLCPTCLADRLASTTADSALDQTS